MKNYNTFSKLENHFNKIKKTKIKDLFQDNQRAKDFTFKLEDLHLDISKNLITKETINLFVELAKEISISENITNMFEAKEINFTEKRAVLHSALRDDNLGDIIIDNKNFREEIIAEKEKLANFVNDFKSKKIKGYSGKDFKSIVNIGIGGSYLGTQMAYNALKDFDNSSLKLYFVSNIDAANLEDILKEIDPETTLFVIASKTFTTQETIVNATTIKNWFIENASLEAVSKHFVALSTNLKKVQEFGIDRKFTFGFWDFIGGRYSIWSAIGLPLQLKIGNEKWQEFLQGANIIDKHLQNTPLEKNIPFILAIIGIWNNNFFGWNSYSILGYDYRLRDFTRYIQQLEMESNGKYINKQGQKVDYQTSPVVFGEPGTDSQHSFFQMLHQGTNIIPCDFIGFIKSGHTHQEHQDILIANMFAQSEALMVGKSKEDVIKELESQDLKEEEIKELTPHKVFEGNRPSNTFLFDKLTPKTLGMLCCLYEHKIFIQGLFWQINSFDQWGVELGKKLAGNILQDIKSKDINNSTNLSTVNLLNIYKNKK